MAAQLSAMVVERTSGKRAGQVRFEYEGVTLIQFSIAAVDHQTAAITEVAVELTIDGQARQGRLRWMCEDADGKVALPADGGTWKLVTWGPYAIVTDRAA